MTRKASLILCWIAYGLAGAVFFKKYANSRSDPKGGETDQYKGTPSRFDSPEMAAPRCRPNMVFGSVCEEVYRWDYLGFASRYPPGGGFDRRSNICRRYDRPLPRIAEIEDLAATWISGGILWSDGYITTEAEELEKDAQPLRVSDQLA